MKTLSHQQLIHVKIQYENSIWYFIEFSCVYFIADQHSYSKYMNQLSMMQVLRKPGLQRFFMV